MKTTDTDALVEPTAADTQTGPLFEDYEEKYHQVTIIEPGDVDALDEPIETRVEPVWDEQPAVDSVESSALGNHWKMSKPSMMRICVFLPMDLCRIRSQSQGLQACSALL